MEKFVVTGMETGLRGRVAISGSKNAVLPILAACLLTGEVCEIDHVPPLSDVRHMVALLRQFGARVDFDEAREHIHVEAAEIASVESAYETARKMRASFLVAGALLGRCGQARLSLPGGCQIGSRPVDLHLKGFQSMGVKSRQEHGVVELQAKTLRGAALILSALAARGDTEISDIYHIERGYDRIDEKLRRLGAEIRRVEESDPAENS